MQKYLFYILTCCLFFSLSPVHAQKKKSKTSHAKHATASKKKSSKKGSKKQNQKETVKPAKPLPPLADVGEFDHIDALYGNGNSNTPTIKNQEAIQHLNEYIYSCINQRAFPGCQILAAKDGEIIYKKNFGYYSYDRMQPVTDTTLYDIASVTKIASTTLAIMKLYEEGKIVLGSYLRNYLPFTIGTDKANLSIRDLLLHQAGLKAFIPFYKTTIDRATGGPRSDLYRTNNNDPLFKTPVASNYYILNTYRDTIWNEILASPLENRGHYVYSDLDYYFLQKVVESVSGMRLDQYVYENFYKPLELQYTVYNPWKRGLRNQCAPTENDQYFRFQTVQGYVHDPGTAMLGGVAGHAGIFSNTKELAIIFQMLMNGGAYKGHRYLKTATLKTFTGFNSDISRRGYGFDKPNKERGDGGPAADLCTKTTFGHQGFTGTCAWADPETGIIFIFLSNRVNPSAENNLINKLGVRTKAQTYIYQALGYGK
jgi:CubicO group peptidase (beta-lactamase class C family)